MIIHAVGLKGKFLQNKCEFVPIARNTSEKEDPTAFEENSKFEDILHKVIANHYSVDQDLKAKARSQKEGD